MRCHSQLQMSTIPFAVPIIFPTDICTDVLPINRETNTQNAVKSTAVFSPRKHQGIVGVDRNGSTVNICKAC